MKPKTKTRHTNVHAAYLILKKADKLLFGKRTNTGYMDDYYGLPAGHAEAGEPLKQTMIREAQEEIGLELKPSQLEFAFLLHRFSPNDPGGQSERIDVFYQCSDWKGTVKNNEPEKCVELQWFDLESLPAKTVPYIEYALKQISNGQVYGELGWDKVFSDGKDPGQTA